MRLTQRKTVKRKTLAQWAAESLFEQIRKLESGFESSHEDVARAIKSILRSHTAGGSFKREEFTRLREALALVEESLNLPVKLHPLHASFQTIPGPRRE